MRGVDFAYGGRKAVDSVEVAVSAGEMLGLIGPNGSGKSTLLRLMGGFLRPQRGQVLIEGRDLSAVRGGELARRVAAVAQEPVIDFPFTVAEVVLMGRAPHLGGALFESDADLAAARAAMRRTGVLPLADRPIHELSGGERQRVILARALAQDCPLLLLDEPTTFLDIRHQADMYDLLGGLRREGRTVVAALHDLNLASIYFPRLALMSAGRLLAVGPPEEVLTAAHLVVAYGTEVQIERNRLTGAINVWPVSRSQ